MVHVASGDVLDRVDVVQCFDQGVVFYDSLVSTRPDRDRPGQDDSPMYSVLQNHFAVNLLWTNLFWHLAIFFSAVRESEIESYVMLAKTGMHKKQRMLTC